MNDMLAPIEDFPSYFISPEGLVFNGRSLTIVSSYLNKGTLQTILWANGNRHTKSVHILVAEAFMEDYDPRLKVWRHDGDPTNCHIDNLYQRNVDRTIADVGENSPLVCVRCLNTDERFYSVREAALALGVSYSSIYKQLRGEVETARGLEFEWEYNL